MRRLASFAVTSVLFVVGCGQGGGSGDDEAADADPGGADALPGDWVELIGSTWTIPPGEQYQCERLTVTEDIWIKAFDADAPLGTHHTVLTVGSGGADGTFPCDAGSNEPAMIYGAGVGTNSITMPDGVAMRVPAGEQLNLNLHLFNTQAAGNLTGTSRVLIQTVPPAEIASVIEAEVVLMGPLSFMIDPGLDTVTGQCTQSGVTNLFMVNPHMHQLGTNMRVVAKRAAGDIEMHDAPYSFNEQKIYPIDTIAMAAGDRVEMTCSYNNTTGVVVPFGDSSEDEMCFATTYRYPALGGAFQIFCPT